MLENRTVILYPDLNDFDKWNEKLLLIKNQCSCEITVSTLLEDIATPQAKAKGLDVADFMIKQLKNIQPDKAPEKSQDQSRFSPELQSMIEENPALMLLLNRLELIEV